MCTKIAVVLKLTFLLLYCSGNKTVNVVVNVKKSNVPLLIFVINHCKLLQMFFSHLAREIGVGKVNLRLGVHSRCCKSLLLVKGRGLARLLPWS